VTFHREPDYQAGADPLRRDRLKRRKLAKISRYASRLFAVNPDLLHVLPAQSEFVPYANVDIQKWRPVSAADDDEIRIVHAPTDRPTKGSRYILDALDKLSRRYPHVKPLIIENMPHERVRACYNAADLAVDQLLAGWYGGFAVEMMAIGKPVVCYIRERDLKFIPERMRGDLPIVNATPETIYSVLEELIESKTRLKAIGEASRAYVEAWHDPVKIASQMKAAYGA